ncbi:peptidoglycan DD-metalloendopeptidase family protein [Marinobacter sp. C2H3]|uniref:peptidoglycan DD-metalloendopeptidase family protein n=1 Tax=Marinobacter sp. C2H3 TaxID=3119003 RepID=UPI00300E9B43
MLPRPKLNAFQKKILAAGIPVVLLAGLWLSGNSTAVTTPIELTLKPDTGAAATDTAGQSEPDPKQETYTIQRGDTLSQLFDARHIPANVLHRILEADSEYLALETLMPGTELTFQFDDQQALAALSLKLDPARTVTFSRQDDDSFQYGLVEADTHWESQILTGRIEGSFYRSGLRAGLTDAQVVSLGQILKHKIDFRRALRAGDPFAVIIGHEITDDGDEATGKTRIEGATLIRGKTTYTAFLHYDGNYYDQYGESVLPAFLRWPTQRHYRVTSSFDPNRLHPVTGRHAPHNGVDLGTPSGTPVMSTGDGVVSRIGNHPYAGRYIDIDHNGSFETRYLHLSKILVRRGQHVKRGEKIALSGATGRVTGPHLHFEFHIKGRPVNPLTAKIPTAASVPRAELAGFKAKVHREMALMDEAVDPSRQLLAQKQSD